MLLYKKNKGNGKMKTVKDKYLVVGADFAGFPFTLHRKPLAILRTHIYQTVIKIKLKKVKKETLFGVSFFCNLQKDFYSVGLFYGIV